MSDDFESQEIRSSGELWSEICSSLPDMQAAENNADFKDSFQPETQAGAKANGESNGTSSSSAKWEPMEDSEVYIASLGIVLLVVVPVPTTGPPLITTPCFAAESRLKKLKGQSSDVTSRDMLRSLSQAKKECWDRFLHDAQTSELFQGGDMDER